VTGHDDFLWDGSGAPDAEVEALAKLLRPLGHDGRPLRPALQHEGGAPTETPTGAPRAAAPSPRTAPAWPWRLAAAALVFAVPALVLLRGGGELRPGTAGRTFVAADRPREIALGTLAQITLDPGSRLRFVHWQQGKEALFALEQGGLSARIVQGVPARFFVMDTPHHGRVVDLGCRYTLKLRDDGAAYVHVTEGAVEFVFPQRTVFVPAGASTTVTKERGPSTPLFDDAPDPLRKAAAIYDEALASGNADQRAKAVEELASATVCSTARDALALWHVLDGDKDLGCRDDAERGLYRIVGAPNGEDSKAQTWDKAIWLAWLRIQW
jgi:hypothetical protein